MSETVYELLAFSAYIVGQVVFLMLFQLFARYCDNKFFLDEIKQNAKTLFLFFVNIFFIVPIFLLMPTEVESLNLCIVITTELVVLTNSSVALAIRRIKLPTDSLLGNKWIRFLLFILLCFSLLKSAILYFFFILYVEQWVINTTWFLHASKEERIATIKKQLSLTKEGTTLILLIAILSLVFLFWLDHV